MLKLLAIDMDGTLLNDKKELTKENIEAITYAQNKGVKVVLATGRPIEGIKKYMDILNMLKDDEYSINFNGAVIYGNSGNKIISSTTINGYDLKQFYKTAINLNANIHAFSLERGLITPKISKYTIHEAELNNIEINIIDFNKIPDDEKIIKAMYIDEPSYLDEYIKNIPSYISSDFYTAKSAPFFYEIMNKDIDKWKGVKKLADYLGINDDEIMCIGDANNDLPMVKNAFIGVAMENATDDVKKVCKFITKNNNDSGVAHAIYKFIK